MIVSNYLITCALLLAPDAGAPALRSATEVAIHWLTALARHDSATVRNLSVFPLLVDGFQSNAGPDENPCDIAPVMTRNSKTREIRVSAQSEAQFDQMIACVFSDSATEEWVERRGRRGFKGTVRLLERPEQSSRRLARHRKEVVPLSSTRTLVEAVTTNRGVTVTAMLVLRPGATGAPAVEAVHTDFLFEE